MRDKVYCYPPDYTVLQNLQGYRDKDALNKFERTRSYARMLEGVPHGKFDLPHLQAIHKHLFQDVYEWAGEIRQTESSKKDPKTGKVSEFGFQQAIPREFAMVHSKLVSANYLSNLSPGGLAKEAGKIIGDINYIHPFREGNGRTQLQYLKQLTNHAGHTIDLSRLDRKSWIGASIEANKGQYAPMGKCIEQALEPEREKAIPDKRVERLLERYKEQKPEGPQRNKQERGKDRDSDRER